MNRINGLLVSSYPFRLRGHPRDTAARIFSYAAGEKKTKRRRKRSARVS